MAKTSDKNLKEELLSRARQLLIRNGYRGFSLREVARKTGVSATSVYLHFENKDHLIHALMEQSIDELNRVLKHVYDTFNEPIRCLEKFALAYTQFALDHPQEYQIIYAVGSDKMSRYPKDKFRKARRGFEFLTETIREGVDQQILQVEQPRIAAYTLWAQLHGVMSVVLTKRLDTRIDRNEFIDQAITHILQGFRMRSLRQPESSNI